MHVADPQYVNETIITLAYVPDEFGVQMLQADFESWDLVAYQVSRSEPLFELRDQAIEDVLVDTPLPWPPDIAPDVRGYTFRHDLVYGDEWKPVVGRPVRLEYTLHRTPDENDNPRGPLCIGKVQPIKDWLSA